MTREEIVDKALDHYRELIRTQKDHGYDGWERVQAAAVKLTDYSTADSDVDLAICTLGELMDRQHTPGDVAPYAKCILDIHKKVNR